MRNYYKLLILIIIGTSCSNTEKEYVYYENGKVKLEKTLVEGKREGETKTYYESGNVEAIIPYSNNMRNGTALYYFENGEVSGKSDYVDGNRHGYHLQYFDNGKLNVNAYFKNGLQDSITTVYSEENDKNYLEKYFIEDTPVWEQEFKNDELIINENIELFTVEFDSDTVLFGEMLTGEIHLIISNLDKIEVILGNLDEEANLIDTLEIIDEYEKFRVKFNVKTNGLGQQLFNGIIQEMHLKSGRYIEKPFQKVYYVNTRPSEI